MSASVVLAPEPEAITFPQFVQRRRRELGLKRHELAANCGISPQIIYRYELGRVGNPNLGTLRQLAIGLGVDASQLFGLFLSQQT